MSRKPKGLTIQEVARIFDLKSTETVKIWLRHGKMKGIKHKKFWYVPEEEVRRFAQERFGPKDA